MFKKLLISGILLWSTLVNGQVFSSITWHTDINGNNHSISNTILGSNTQYRGTAIDPVYIKNYLNTMAMASNSMKGTGGTYTVTSPDGLVINTDKNTFDATSSPVITLKTGNATYSLQPSGGITLETGSSDSGSAGTINVTGGNASGSGIAASLFFTAGSGAGNAFPGNMVFTAGNGGNSGTDGGFLEFNSGTTSDPSGKNGYILLTAGENTISMLPADGYVALNQGYNGIKINNIILNGSVISNLESITFANGVVLYQTNVALLASTMPKTGSISLFGSRYNTTHGLYTSNIIFSTGFRSNPWSGSNMVAAAYYMRSLVGNAYSTLGWYDGSSEWGFMLDARETTVVSPRLKIFTPYSSISLDVSNVLHATYFRGNGSGITGVNFANITNAARIYTNVNPTTISAANGGYYLDAGSNTVNFNINGTWKYVNLNNF